MTYLIERINKIINENWNIFFRKILFPFLLTFLLIDILITYLIEIINESWNIFFRTILFQFLLIIVLIDILNRNMVCLNASVALFYLGSKSAVYTHFTII